MPILAARGLFSSFFHAYWKWTSSFLETFRFLVFAWVNNLFKELPRSRWMLVCATAEATNGMIRRISCMGIGMLLMKEILHGQWKHMIL